MIRWWLFKKLSSDVIYYSMETDNCRLQIANNVLMNYINGIDWNVNISNWCELLCRLEKLNSESHCLEWEKLSYCFVTFHFIPFNSQLSVSAIENDLNETDICVKVFHRNLMLRFFLPSILLMDLLFNQKQKLNLFKWKMRIFARKLEKIISNLLLESQHPFAEILWA